MVSRLDGILGMNLNNDDGEEVSFANSENGTPNPYLFYSPETGAPVSAPAGGEEKRSKAKSKSTGSSSLGGGGSSSRPKSASRKR